MWIVKTEHNWIVNLNTEWKMTFWKLKGTRKKLTFRLGFVFHRHRSRNFALKTMSTSHIKSSTSLFFPRLLSSFHTCSAPTRSPFAVTTRKSCNYDDCSRGRLQFLLNKIYILQSFYDCIFRNKMFILKVLFFKFIYQPLGNYQRMFAGDSFLTSRKSFV